MRWWSLLALAGCDRILGLGSVRAIDASHDAVPTDGSGVDAADITCPPTYTLDAITHSHYRAGLGGGQDFLSVAAFCASDEQGLSITGHTHLAVVSDEIEREVLAQYSEFWIGITDLSSQAHVFRWVSTESVALDPTAANTMLWASGEPNNLDSEMCGYFQVSTPGQLNNTDCSDQREYLCECDIYPNDPTAYK